NKNIEKQLPSKLLGPVLDFMAMAGLSEVVMRKEFERALKQSGNRRGKEAGNATSGKFRPQGDVSAHLLRLWHRDGRYINGRTLQPRSLPLLRGRSNLRSLIEELDPEARPTDALREMRAAGLIRSTP